MVSDGRIAVRYVFEARIQIRFTRGQQKLSTFGWARDLSESGLGGYVGENLWIGQEVVLRIPGADGRSHDITAKVARQVGTQYGFQFTALSVEQRNLIRALVEGANPIQAEKS